MRIQNQFSGIGAGLLALLIGVVAARAQEFPLPPPRVRAGIFFSSLRQDFPGRKVVTGEPFSAQAVTKIVQTLADGNVITHETTSQLFRDSLGRTRREFTLGFFGPWRFARRSGRQIIVISDPSTKVRYILNPAQHTAFEMPNRRIALRIMPGTEGSATTPPRGAAGPDAGGRFFYVRAGGKSRRGAGFKKTTISLGKRTMQGLEVDGDEIVRTIPAGAIGNERPIKIVTKRWFSPELQLVLMSERRDPRFGVTTYRLEHINLQEPPPQLFQVPASYTLEKGPVTVRVHPR